MAREVARGVRCAPALQVGGRGAEDQRPVGKMATDEFWRGSPPGSRGHGRRDEPAWAAATGGRHRGRSGCDRAARLRRKQSTAPTTNTDTAAAPAATGSSACSTIPRETAGPFPADGSNGPTVLGASGVVRSDIRPSFAGLSGTADGVPLTIALTIVSASTCSPLAGRAVYLWHCDRLGRYSLYSPGATDQNYLRGVQEADGSGRVTFTSIYPACYSGRWPHIHFEGVPKSRGRHQRGQQDRDLADRVAQGHSNT